MFPTALYQFSRSSRTPSRKKSKRQPLIVQNLESRDVPAPLTWTMGPGLPTARGGVVAIQAANATTVVLGGPTNDVPSFAAANPTWQTSMKTAGLLDVIRNSGGVGIMPNGGILLFGGKGNSGNNGQASTTLYDYTGDATDNGASMHSSRYLLGFATDPNHHVFAIGGKSNATTTLSSVEWYNQTADAWTLVAPMPTALSALSAVADTTGHIFAIGGVDSGGAISSTVYRYTIATNTWDTVAPLPAGTANGAAVLAPNGLIYLLGGVTSAGTTANVESYNETTNTWNVEAPLPAAVKSEAATVDNLGRIVIAGGFDASNSATAAVSISQQLGQPDAAPTFATTTPTSRLVVNAAYNYQVLTNANPQATYSLIAAPAGMTIDATTGLVTWSANAEGSQTVTIQASNSVGQSTQSFALLVVPAAPTGVTAIGASTSSISLAWDTSTDPGVTGYNVYLRTYHPNAKGSGGTYTYGAVGTNLTSNSLTVGGLTSGKSYTYVVTAVHAPGVVSSYSAAASAGTWFAPTLRSDFLLSIGAVWSSPAPAVYGQSVQITLLGSGNPAPIYSIVSGPSTLSVDPHSGVVTYVPSGTDFGIVNFTAQVSNAVGTSAPQNFSFDVKWAPTITVTGGTYPLDGYPHPATATATGVDGLPVAGTMVISYLGSAGAPTLYTGTYTVVANFTSADSNYASATGTGSITLSAPVPPQVGSVVVNGGAAQRSEVTSVAVNFNQHVSLPANPADAFLLNRDSDHAGVALTAAVDNTGQTTVVTLTFVGGAVDSGSLQDGRYDLTASAALVSNPGGQLDGVGDGIGGIDYTLTGTPANGLFRLFGDANGDGSVGANDFVFFRQSFNGTSDIFDFDGDGTVSVSDFVQFRQRFGTSI
jgi:Kelch motif/Fibronectin type III domain/Putative Ig domain